MKRLTPEQIEKWAELVDALKQGKLFYHCPSCKKFYRVNKKSFGSMMCDKCMEGVAIPDFSQSLNNSHSKKQNDTHNLKKKSQDG